MQQQIITLTAGNPMGIQSQLRNGSIKACKKRATKAKHRKKHLAQMSVDRKEARAFVPEVDCRICVAKIAVQNGSLKQVPHRAHDPRCKVNQKTKGLSERTVQVEKIAAENIRQNNIPPVLVPREEALKNASDLMSYYGGGRSRITAGDAVAKVVQTNGQKTLNSVSDSSNTTIDLNMISAITLQTEISNCMQSETLEEKYKWATKSTMKAPMAIALAINQIVERFKHRRPKKVDGLMQSTDAFANSYNIFRTIFPTGKAEFHFPVVDPSVGAVDPVYHAIEGQSFFYLDWELICLPQELKIPCFQCKLRGQTSFLVHDRTNFGRTRSLFPLWRGDSGVTSWCVVMYYICPCSTCKTYFAANDGRVLSLLPAWLRQQYPVAPSYATGSFHLDETYTDLLESLMVTSANASVLAKLMFRKYNKAYVTKIESYLSMKPTKDFVDEVAFHGRAYPPSPETLRDLFLESEQSFLQPYGFSNESRFNREIQAVSVEETDMVAIDWTFQVIKNYQLPGAHACFTSNKGSTSEITLPLIVDSTKASQIAHGIVSARQNREKFSPRVLYTDTCPHNVAFWRLLFGATLVVRLGLFHLIQRIYRTLDTKSHIFWECLVQLKETMYSYNTEDIGNLYRCLRDGTLNGKKHSGHEIEDLRHSNRWNDRYGSYLRKAIHAGPVIQQKIDCWIRKFARKKDVNGRAVFTRETEKVAKEQLQKVQYVSDATRPGTTEHYTEIRAGPKSTHGLPKYKSMLPESLLEKFHELLAHFGNTGMRAELADVLCLRGTAEWNVRCRWRQHVNNGDLNSNLPQYLQELPPYFDHSMLHYLNESAKALSLTRPFNFVTLIHEDNGERFFSRYFKEQAERNQLRLIDESSKLCKCAACLVHFAGASAVTTGSLEETSLDDQALQGEQGSDLDVMEVEAAGEMPMEAVRHGVQLAVTSPRASAHSTLFTPHSNCKACEYEFLRMNGQRLRGRPPHHDLYCPKAGFINFAS